MRILLVNDSAFELGGAERYLFSLASLLRDAGHEVEILGKSGLPGKAVLLTRLYNPVWSHRAEEAIKRFRPDIVHAHHISFILSPSVLGAARRKRVPVVMTVHDFHLVCPKTWLTRDHGETCDVGFSWECIRSGCARSPYDLYASLKLWLHRRLIAANVDRFIAPSRILARFLERSAGFRDVQVVPNFVPDDTFSPAPIEESKTICFVGRLVPEKGAEFLIRAMPLILQQEPDARLVVVGDGEQGDYLRRICRESGISQRVDFKGWRKQDELHEEYDASQLFCLPSIWMENCPLVLLESIVRRRPAIASATGGVPELVRDGETGLLFRPGDQGDLADKAIRLLADFPLCKKMSEELGRIAGLYSAERHLERLTEIYSSCL